MSGVVTQPIEFFTPLTFCLTLSDILRQTKFASSFFKVSNSSTIAPNTSKAIILFGLSYDLNIISPNPFILIIASDLLSVYFNPAFVKNSSNPGMAQVLKGHM